MICYICKCEIGGDLQALVAHYKIIHLLKPDSTYTCLENSCNQSFNCMSSFKRHVNRKHVIIIPETYHSVKSNSHVQGISSSISSTEKCPVTDNSNNHDELKNTFNFGNSAKDLYELTLKFILSLYNNNNFNNKDVIYIQSGITENILKPIASILKSMVKINISEPILISTFNRLEGLIIDHFSYCNSEYNLNNWLKVNKYISSIQQITINNQICPVNYSGEICYNEKVTKGALLPLKLQFQQFFEHNNIISYYL